MPASDRQMRPGTEARGKLDLGAISSAITGAINLLDQAGHQKSAETLRVHGPELLRLARIGMAIRNPDVEHRPTDALIRKSRDHA
jgi:hypothetical protein